MAMRRWKYTLDIKSVWEDDDLSLSEKGKAIVKAIKAAPFWAPEGRDEIDFDLEQITEELEDAAEADDVVWFDDAWNSFYDWADANHVWVKTAF